MTRIADKSDLTDKEWQIIKPLILPPKPGGHPLGRYAAGSKCDLLFTKNRLFMGDATP
jgi:transposase